MQKTRRQRNTVEPLDKDVHIRIRQEYMEKLKRQAIKKGYTNSRMLRYIVEQYLDKNES